MAAEKYQFKKALRPFSFSVAIVVCLTGILTAYKNGYADHLLAALVLIAGLLLQAGVNLINDYSDLKLPKLKLGSDSRQKIRHNFIAGLVCLLVSTVIGLYLVIVSGWVLLLFSMIGIIGALGYTLEPINYKRRGLAVVAVFWLMGVLMVTGAYYALSSQVTLTIFVISIPVSLYTSLLLLSNELRDFESDQADEIRTLTVRIGYQKAERLYYMLLAAVYIASLLLSISGVITYAWVVLLSLPFAMKPIRYLAETPDNRMPLTSLTGKSFFVYGLCYCTAILFSSVS